MKVGFGVKSDQVGQKRTAVLPLFTGLDKKISFSGIMKVECNSKTSGDRKDQWIRRGGKYCFGCHLG